MSCKVFRDFFYTASAPQQFKIMVEDPVLNYSKKILLTNFFTCLLATGKFISLKNKIKITVFIL